jgi:hypothetical protein
MTAFDRYIAVDWSGSSRPRQGRDSIWIANLAAVGTDVHSENPSTRRQAERRLAEQLGRAVAARQRVLVGCDFPFGYPRGLGVRLGLSGAPWRATWDHLSSCIRDDDANANNRFEVASRLNQQLGNDAAFWGVPASSAGDHLTARRRVVYSGEVEAGGLPEWRAVEMTLRRRGRRPHSAWKLLGAGSVGGQALLGIPMLERLRTHPSLAPVSRVWPFEVAVPELPFGTPAIVYAEIWPSLVDCGGHPGWCRDQRQVGAAVSRWRSLDRLGELAGSFATPKDDPAVALEEGWILGVAPE